jgi:phospholipid/cholesterol/gamma-HCH transport system substrate-binding protein
VRHLLHLTLRRQHILTGAIALVLVMAAVTVGVKGAFGAFKGGYALTGSFDAAGQGLLSGSDVKIRGVNVGEVDSIDLVDGRALVKLRIDDGERIPRDATATIRPKTLFGEKFVDIDPGPAEEDGPFLADGDVIEKAIGGFELEKVLTDIYPILQAIDPVELATVLGELAEGGRGLGETINRSIVNGEELSKLFADNADLTRKFLGDMAALSDQLAASAGDLLATADAANVALPTLNEGEDDLVALLQQTGRLSNDVADLLENNQPFVQASLGDGSRGVQILFDRRDQVVPLVIGLRQYVESLASVLRIEVGDGTLMAAVKGILGGEFCGAVACPGTGTEPEPPIPGVPPITIPPLPTLPPLPTVPSVPTVPSLPGLPLGGTSSTTSGGLFGVLNRAILG